MKKTSIKLLSLIFSCTVLFSCSNLIDDDTFAVDSNSLEKVTVTGKISVSGAVPTGIANARSASCVTCGRTAFPTMPEGSEYYFFKTRDLDSGVEDDAAGYAYTDGTYEFSLIIGRRFEVTAGISSDDEHNNVILSTSWETPVVSRENASTLGKNIILEPGTEGTGTVELLMTVDSSVQSVTCSSSAYLVSGYDNHIFKIYIFIPIFFIFIKRIIRIIKSAVELILLPLNFGIIMAISYFLIHKQSMFSQI